MHNGRINSAPLPRRSNVGDKDDDGTTNAWDDEFIPSRCTIQPVQRYSYVGLQKYNVVTSSLKKKRNFLIALMVNWSRTTKVLEQICAWAFRTVQRYCPNLYETFWSTTTRVLTISNRITIFLVQGNIKDCLHEHGNKGVVIMLAVASWRHFSVSFRRGKNRTSLSNNRSRRQFWCFE